MSVFINGTIPSQFQTRSNACTVQMVPIWGLSRYWHSTKVLRPKKKKKQVSAYNRLLSNASTEPMQISELAWYRFTVPRQCRWTTSSYVTFRSRAGGRPWLSQHCASTAPVLQLLLRYWHLLKFCTPLESTKRKYKFVEQPHSTKIVKIRAFFVF